MQRIDTDAGLFDILGDGVRQQLRNDTLKIAGGDVPSNDLAHLPADLAHLCVLSIAGLVKRHWVLHGEADAEDTEQVAVECLHISAGFDQSLPLLGHGTKLVCCQIHTVEVGEHFTALDIFSNETELTEGPVIVIN